MATLISDNLDGWAPGTRHYRTDNGVDLAVEAPSIPEGQCIPRGVGPMIDELLIRLGTNRGAVKHVVRPTVVFECNPDGTAIDLTPIHTFPSGTTHEEVLAELGY